MSRETGERLPGQIPWLQHSLYAVQGASLAAIVYSALQVRTEVPYSNYRLIRGGQEGLGPQVSQKGKQEREGRLSLVLLHVP